MPEERIVVGIGELLWDVFPDHTQAGGAPANVAYHAQLLGDRGMICSRVGEDTLGDQLLQHLADKTLDTSLIQHDAQHATGTVTVDSSQPNRPTYEIHEPVAWDFLELTKSWIDLIGRASAVCYGTLAQRSKVSRRTIKAILASSPNPLKVYDVNLRPPHYDRQIVSTSMKLADVVKLNLDEVRVLGELLALDDSGPQRFAEAIFSEFGVQTVCITRGADGCAICTADARAEVPGTVVNVVDAVGAGDAFTAALIHGLLRGWPLNKTANLANQIGAMVTSRAGAMPELQNEYSRIRNET